MRFERSTGGKGESAVKGKLVMRQDPALLGDREHSFHCRDCGPDNLSLQLEGWTELSLPGRKFLKKQMDLHSPQHLP